MEYVVEVGPTAAQCLATVRGQANQENLTAQIRPLFDRVYSLLRAVDVGPLGYNVILYWDEAGRDLLHTPGGLTIEIGVQVPAPFTSDNGLRSSATPAGLVARTTHVGEYDQLGRAHEAILRWSRERGRPLAGPNWEIYGHWHDQVELRKTEVVYLLQA